MGASQGRSPAVTRRRRYHVCARQLSRPLARLDSGRYRQSSSAPMLGDCMLVGTMHQVCRCLSGYCWDGLALGGLRDPSSCRRVWCALIGSAMGGAALPIASLTLFSSCSRPSPSPAGASRRAAFSSGRMWALQRAACVRGGARRGRRAPAAAQCPLAELWRLAARAGMLVALGNSSYDL